MKAWVATEYGGLEIMTLKEMEKPTENGNTETGTRNIECGKQDGKHSDGITATPRTYRNFLRSEKCGIHHRSARQGRSKNTN